MRFGGGPEAGVEHGEGQDPHRGVDGGASGVGELGEGGLAAVLNPSGDLSHDVGDIAARGGLAGSDERFEIEVGVLGGLGHGERDVVGFGEVAIQRPAARRGEGHRSAGPFGGAVRGRLGLAGPHGDAGGFEDLHRDAQLAVHQLTASGVAPARVVEIDLVLELFKRGARR